MWDLWIIAKELWIARGVSDRRRACALRSGQRKEEEKELDALGEARRLSNYSSPGHWQSALRYALCDSRCGGDVRRARCRLAASSYNHLNKLAQGDTARPRTGYRPFPGRDTRQGLLRCWLWMVPLGLQVLAPNIRPVALQLPPSQAHLHC